MNKRPPYRHAGYVIRRIDSDEFGTRWAWQVTTPMGWPLADVATQEEAERYAETYAAWEKDQ